MKKTIFIIGAGIMQLSTIQIAKKMGLRTIVTDYNPEAIGMKEADVPIVMSTKDIEGNVREAKNYNRYANIDGVITVGTDASMTVAAVANSLKLPGLKFEVAERATNKIKMRESLKKHDVPSPDFAGVWSIDEAIKTSNSLGYPVVIKPADNMGARGVRRIDNEDELKEGFRKAKLVSPSGEIIIENYMDGDELSIDLLIYDSEIVLQSVADRIIKYPPYFIEVGHNMPSSKSEKIINEAIDVMMQGVRALGIDIGAAKGDIKLTENGPMIGEIAARLSGGFMSSYTYPYATGQDMIKGAIEISLGKKPVFNENPLKRYSVERSIIPSPGRIENIEGVTEAKLIPGVKDIFIDAEIGDIVVTPQNNMDKAGHIITVGDTLKQAVESAEKALNTIKIEIGPPPVITLENIKTTARKKLYNVCKVCRNCDGIACAGEMPGMGSVGSGATFINNVKKLAEIKLNQRIIHSIDKTSSELNFLDYHLSTPIMAAPVAGTVTNLDGAISEFDYANSVIKGCRESGSIAFLGDGANPEKYKTILNAAQESDGWAIPIFKPLKDINAIMKRINKAAETGIKTVGIDIDAVSLITMENKGKHTSPKSYEVLKKIIDDSRMNFIVKGIMSPDDAVLAVKAGVSAIIVSNHGGRTMDYLPATIEVLPSIIKKVNGKIPVLIDGGFRSGEDILKSLAFGAAGVLIGRPIIIAAVGGGMDGVKLYINNLTQQLKKCLLLTGCASLKDITRKIIFRG